MQKTVEHLVAEGVECICMNNLDSHLIASVVAPVALLLGFCALLLFWNRNKVAVAIIFGGVAIVSVFFPLQWGQSIALDLRPIAIALACFVASPLVGFFTLLISLSVPVAFSDPLQGSFLFLFTYFALGLLFFYFKKTLTSHFRSAVYLMLGVSVFFLNSILNLEFYAHSEIHRVWITAPFSFIFFGLSSFIFGLRLHYRQTVHESNQSIQSRQQFFDRMLSSSQHGFFRIRDGIIIESNAVAENILGIPMESLLGALFDNIVPFTQSNGKNSREYLQACIKEIQQKGSASFPWTLKNSLETSIECDTYFLHIDSKGGYELGIFFQETNSMKDMSVDSLATAIFEAAREAMIITDAKANILRVNHAFERMTGYTAEEVVGKNPRILKSSQQDAQFFRDLWMSIRNNGFWEGEIWNQKKHGEIFPCHLRISVSNPSNEHDFRYIGVFTDLAAIAKSEEVLTQISLFDPLTQLESRAGLLLRLTHQHLITDFEKQSIAVIAMDIGNFKGINNSYGHVAGDQLLKAFAKRLLDDLDGNTHFARLGSDEFLAFTVQNTPEIQLQAFFEKIARAVRAPFIIGEESVFLSITVGIVIADNSSVPEALIKQADTALHEAKKDKAPYKIYDSRLQSQAMSDLLLSKRLKIAIENHIIDVYYQPKINLSTGLIHGMEALARWKDEQGKFIPPIVFIPLAEKNGLINHLFQVIVSKTVKDMAHLFLPIQPDLMVSINLSSHQFEVENLVQEITCRVDHEHIAREHFEFEVTESVFINNMEATRHILEEFKSEGFQLSLDDFGTGFSSLTYLNNLPFDTLKIDKSFVDPVPTELRSNAMTQSIVNLAHSINLRCVAEGVESQEQLDFLRLLKCDFFQGYLFSPPVDRSHFVEMLKTQREKQALKDSA